MDGVLDSVGDLEELGLGVEGHGDGSEAEEKRGGSQYYSFLPMVAPAALPQFRLGKGLIAHGMRLIGQSA